MLCHILALYQLHKKGILAMLEIWGRPYSSNVIPVIWTAAECGVDYKLKLAGGSFGQLETPEFAAMNPNRLIPTIRDGDFALWESNAIVRYLCAKYAADALCPDDIEKRAMADQWMEWSGTTAFPPVIQLFFATVRTEPVDRDSALVKQHASEAARVLTTRFKNIEAWYARLCERPAFQKHVMRFFGSNPDDWRALELASAAEGD